MTSAGMNAAMQLLPSIACLLALAMTVFASILVVKAERRMLAAHQGAQTCLNAGSKAFDSAQRRLLLAQDEVVQKAAEISTSAGDAAARMTGLTRELEAKLRGFMAETQERFDLAAGSPGESPAWCPWTGGGTDSLADLLAGLLPSLLGATLHDLLPVVQAELEDRLILAGVPAIDDARQLLEDAAAQCRRLMQDAGSEIAAQGQETLRTAQAAMEKNVLTANEIVARLQSIATGAADITRAGDVMTQVVAGVETMADKARQSARLLAESAAACASWPRAAAALTESAEALTAARLAAENPGLAGAVQDCLTRVHGAMLHIEDTTSLQHHSAGKLAAAAEKLVQAIPPAASRAAPAAQGLLPQANALRKVAETLASASHRMGHNGLSRDTACAASGLLGDVETAIVILQETAAMLSSTSNRERPAA